MKYNDILIPETKEEAELIIKVRQNEIREINGLSRIHPKSWVEMFMAKIYLEI